MNKREREEDVEPEKTTKKVKFVEETKDSVEQDGQESKVVEVCDKGDDTPVEVYKEDEGLTECVDTVIDAVMSVYEGDDPYTAFDGVPSTLISNIINKKYPELLKDVPVDDYGQLHWIVQDGYLKVYADMALQDEETAGNTRYVEVDIKIPFKLSFGEPITE